VEQILPGVWHWSAYHQGIRQDVHSHFLAGARTLIDPMLPGEGLEWFEGERRPEWIVLTNRHHYRHSDRFVEAFGCPVLCPEVEGYAFGDEVAPGVEALEVAAICPEETALYASDPGLVSVADGVIRSEGRLAFVPDFLLGDDPEGVKEGLRVAYRRISQERDFDNLLLAHGEPLIGGAREAVSAFASP
jgi:hypothetical protein